MDNQYNEFNKKERDNDYYSELLLRKYKVAKNYFKLYEFYEGDEQEKRILFLILTGILESTQAIILSLSIQEENDDKHSFMYHVNTMEKFTTYLCQFLEEKGEYLNSLIPKANLKTSDLIVDPKLAKEIEAIEKYYLNNKSYNHTNNNHENKKKSSTKTKNHSNIPDDFPIS